MRPISLFSAFLLFATLAAAQSPLLLVLNKTENTMVMVDPASRKVVGKVATGEGPHEVTVSNDGKLAFVANYGAREPGSTLSAIDIAAVRELRRVDLGALRRPHGMAFGDGKVYFTAEANKLIGRYDPASDRIDWLLGTGQNLTHMLVLSPDLSRIFTANIGSDSVSAIERVSAPAGWNQSVIAVGKGPEGIDLSPDGKELWTAHSRDGGVSVIDVAEHRVLQTLDLHTRRSNRLKFTPDGKRVLISDLEADEVLVLDAASRKEIKRLKPGRSPEGVLITPDGKRAYVAVASDNAVAVVDLNILEVTDHIPTGSGPDGMAWVERK
ncbi:MAG TPA: beta-propeller fold lactonase family protein [Terriglobales bacterium]|nr:beta-propeller fold lactonase family protein [Terriglobales bacterium]